MTTANDLTTTWGRQLQPAVCDHCDWTFLLADDKSRTCPHCFKGELQPFDDDLEHLPSTVAPEIILPFEADKVRMMATIAQFAGSIPLHPEDLSAQNLVDRTRKIYWPMWLVDADVKAQWKAEFGFKYDVKSHRTSYQNGQWHTQEVLESHADWEPRVGMMVKRLDNVPAPALEEHRVIVRQTGQYDDKKGKPYASDMLEQTAIRLPGRSTEDSYGDAEIGFKKRAASTCCKAAEGDDVRNYEWQHSLENLNWTQLLLPVYTTYYKDDDDNVRIVWINGQNGFISGSKRASLKRGQQILTLGWIAASIIAVLGIVLSFLGNSGLLMGGLILGAIVGVGSIVPYANAWQFNEQEKKREQGQPFTHMG